jgi:hypothetical protein
LNAGLKVGSHEKGGWCEGAGVKKSAGLGCFGVAKTQKHKTILANSLGKFRNSKGHPQ